VALVRKTKRKPAGPSTPVRTAHISWIIVNHWC